MNNINYLLIIVYKNCKNMLLDNYNKLKKIIYSMSNYVN